MRTNSKLNPHMTPSPGIEPGPHWWERSALTTAPSLLPQGVILIINVIQRFFFWGGGGGGRVGNAVVTWSSLNFTASKELTLAFDWYTNSTCIHCIAGYQSHEGVIRSQHWFNSQEDWTIRIKGLFHLSVFKMRPSLNGYILNMFFFFLRANKIVFPWSAFLLSVERSLRRFWFCFIVLCYLFLKTSCPFLNQLQINKTNHDLLALVFVSWCLLLVFALTVLIGPLCCLRRSWLAIARAAFNSASN